MDINNGLMIQWGSIAQTTSSLSVNFGVAFNTSKLYVNIAIENLSNTGINAEAWHSANNITQTTFFLYSDGNGKNFQRRYFAIGY